MAELARMESNKRRRRAGDRRPRIGIGRIWDELDAVTVGIAKVECSGTVFKRDGEPPQAVPSFLERDPTRELVACVVSTGNVG